MKMIKSSYVVSRIIAIILALIIFQSGFEIQAVEGDYEKELSILVSKYKNNEYDAIIEKLEKLLNEIGEEQGQIRGQFFLLLGAAYEKKGVRDKAIENYLLGDLLLDKPEVEGIDLNSLNIFMSTLYGKVIDGKRVFEKVSKRRKKRKFPFLAILGALAIVVTVFILMKKKIEDPGLTRPELYANEIFNQIDWITIPSGEFVMGDVNNLGDEDEKPVHNVYLDSYKISKLEITFEQFDKYSRATQLWDPSSEGWGREDRPVINVRWGEVLMFCEWLSEYTKKKIMIPTEAQWEKAAIGTSKVIYPWGNSAPGCSRTNYNNCIGKTEPVGSYPLDISVYGVLDMGGNVAELVRDGYQADYYSISPYSNPEGPDLESSDNRVVKGGNWSSNDLRASNRSIIGKFSRNEMTGFRIVWID